MSAVDERVVRMEFDNKQFEQNIKQSIKSLDDLDKQLGLVGEEDAFDNIDKSSKKIDFSHLLGGVGKVSDGFSALEAIALGALTRIGSKLTDIVTQYAGFFTIKQIGAGWQKFAEVTKTTLTTMSATADTWEKEADELAKVNYLYGQLGDMEGAEALYELFSSTKDTEKETEKLRKSLDMEKDAFYELWNGVQQTTHGLQTHEQFVEGYVDNLNWYSDETSYNLTDMTGSVSKLVGAGEQLGDATSEIQGFMNMVAKAGGDAQIGIRASTQFIQAMSKGTMQLQDWRSLEGMNVANADFRQKLIDTAVAMGKVTKEVKKNKEVVYSVGSGKKKKTFTATSGFDETLALGWMDKKVMAKTLKDYAKFSDGLYKIVQKNDEYGIDATTSLDRIHEYQDLVATGADAEEIQKYRDRITKDFGDDKEAADAYIDSLIKLSDKEYDFSREAFEAGQEARTFKDSIDATADAVSTKWSKIFQFMFGSAETAKAFWTNFTGTLYEIFVTPLNDIIRLFNQVKKSAGIFDDGEEIDAFEAFRRSLNNLQEALLNIINPIREAFGEVFLQNAVKSIQNFSQAFLDFSKKLILGEEGIEKVKNAFVGLFTIVRGITKIFTSAFKIVKPIFGLLSPIARLLGTLASKIGLVISAFAEVKESDAGSVVEKIADAVGKAVQWITEQLDALTEWIDKNIDLEGLVSVFGIVKTAFVTAFNAIKGAVSKAWSYIQPFLPTFEEIQTVLTNVWNTVKQFLPTWEEVVSALQKGWEWFSKVAGTIWNFVKPYIDQLGEALGKFWGKISKFIEGFAKADNKMQYLKDNILGVVDAFLEWKRNSSFVKWVVKQFENVKKVVQDIKEALKPKEGESGSGSFFGILYLVASLAALLAIMRNVKNISTGFKNLTQAIKRFSTSIKRVVTFAGLYLIVKALTALITALKSFAELDPGKIAWSVGAVMLLGLGLLGFAAMMKKITKEMSEGDIKSFKKVTITLAIVLLAIAASMWILSKSSGLTWEPLMLIGILTAVVIAAYALSKYVGDVKVNTILTLAVLAAVLLAAAFAIEKIAKLDATQFEQARNIILILAGVALAAMIVGAILNKGSETMKNIAIAVGVMAAALLIIVIALNQLKSVKMNWQIAGLLIGIMLILAILAAIPVYMAKFAKSNGANSKDVMKMAGTVTGMAISMLLICAAIGLMAKAMAKYNISAGDMLALSAVILVIGITLGIMAVALAGATAILGKSESKLNDMKKTAKAVRSMVVSLLLIVAALAIMTKLKMTVESTTEAMNIIWNVIIMLGVLTLALAGASKLAGKRGLKSGPIIAMVLGIIALVGTLMVLTKFIEHNGNTIGKAAIVMGGIMLALGVMALLIGAATAVAGEKGLQWGAIAVMMLGVMGIAHMMILMSAIPAKQLTTVGLVLGGIIVAIGLLAIAMGILQNNSSSWGNVARAAVMMIVAVGAVIALVFALKQLEDADVSWKTLGQLGAMAGGLLVFVGVLVLLSGLATGGAIGLLVISVVLIAIAAAMVILSVAAYIAAEALPKFVAGIQQLIDVISSMDVSAKQFWTFVGILAAAAILGTLAMIGIGVGALIMAAGIAIGAFALSLVAGILPQVSAGLVILVMTLVMLSQYADVAATTAWKLAEAFLALMLAGIAIGIGLAVAGVGLGVVALAAMGLATAILIASLGVSTFVSALALLAQGVALVADIFNGGNLSSQVSTFADNVKSGADNITQSVSELQTAINNGGEAGADGGGFLQSLLGAGGGGTPDFVSMLGLSGEGGLKDQLTSFFSEEGGMGDLDIMGMLTGGEGGAGLFGDMDFGADITNALSGGIGNIDTSQLSGMLGGKLEGVFNFEEMDLGGSFITSVTSGLEGADLGPTGEEVAGSFVTGVQSKNSAAKSAGQTLGNNGKTGAGGTRSNWVSTGSSLGEGLISGIRSQLSGASAAGQEIAKAAYEAAKNYLNINSPSRIFMALGESTVEGFTVGINDNTEQAAISARNMAVSSFAAVSEVLADTIMNDYTNPVIRPTLDLSNVAAGAAGISSMFGNQTVGVNGQYTNGTAPTGNTVYNYTQNNYSPKALDRIEIYRQTKNQINGSNVLASV